MESLYCNLSFLLCFIAIIINHSFAQDDTSDNSLCSAINAYVAITNPLNLRMTLLSAQALFTPYRYYLESTSVVTLNNNDNNGCVSSSNLITTDVSNQIVLIWRNNGNCSEHSKVSILEQAGAVGVLIANDENGNYVEKIVDDNGVTMSTTIPSRMITQHDGSLIENYLESGSNNGTLLMEIGCLNI